MQGAEADARRARRRSTAGALVTALCLLGASGGEGPVAAVRQVLSEARAVVLADGPRDAKLDSLHGLARRLVDTRAMGRRSLDPELAAQPPALQAEFLELFDEFIVRAYLQKLLLFRNPRFGFRREEWRGEVALVRTRIITAKDEYSVDYEMRERDGAWTATDIVVEGISLSENYGDQFRSLLRTRSFEELLELMSRKVRRYRGGDFG
jgi:phospholipid transport system substrate-binding protein